MIFNCLLHHRDRLNSFTTYEVVLHQQTIVVPRLKRASYTEEVVRAFAVRRCSWSAFVMQGVVRPSTGRIRKDLGKQKTERRVRLVVTADTNTKLRCVRYVICDQQVTSITAMHPLHECNEVVAVALLSKEVLIPRVERQRAPNWEAFATDRRFEMIAREFVHVLEVIALQRNTPRPMKLIGKTPTS